MKLLTLALAVGLGPWTGPARVEHARITLDVVAEGSRETAHVDQTPPAWGKNPRPIVRSKVGDRVKVQYVLTNAYPHKTLENVVVHFFVARQSKAGQDELPDLAVDEALILETAFDLDLKPGAKAGAKASLSLARPGAYLIRVETRNTASDHEHFSAIDLIVESPGPTGPQGGSGGVPKLTPTAP